MKKLWIIPVVAMLLAGCAGNPSLETVTDVQDTQVAATVQKILLQLPPELSAPVLQDEQGGQLYLCDDYTVTVRIVESGDLKQTVCDATGMEPSELDILKSQQGDAKRYQWVWAAAGENGMQVGRGCVLDDGAYHYVLTALADETKTEKVQSAWKEMFASFRLTMDKEPVSTGS